MFNPAAEQLFELSAARGDGAADRRLHSRSRRALSAAADPQAAPRRASRPEACAGAASRSSWKSRSRAWRPAEAAYLSVIARDVTQRKELERLLLQKDKLESLGLLAGGIAHDFNNLLVGIMGNASLALETISSNNPARTMLKDVVHGERDAPRNLTRQLLAYAGKGRFVIEPVDLSDLVRQISNLLQTCIPKNVQLRLELAEDLPSVEADASSSSS